MISDWLRKEKRTQVGTIIYDPEKHHRKSIRLEGFDYSQAGAYFVTILTKARVCRFGSICNRQMCLTDLGRIARDEWERLEFRFPHITVDEFVLIPNHLHGILVINGKGEAGSLTGIGNENQQLRPMDLQDTNVHQVPLGVIVGAYKSTVSRLYRVRRTSRCEVLWHRNYYEHIIRDEEEWEKIRLYIQTNPVNWLTKDEYFIE